MKKIFLFFMIAALFLVTGCATKQLFSAAQEFQTVNKEGSISYLVEVLKNKPDHEDAQKLLQEIYPQAAEEFVNKAKNFAQTHKYYLAIGELDRVIALNDLIKRSPGVPALKDIAEIRSTYITQAADYYYKDGIKSQEKENFAEAARDFRLCVTYSPGYKDAEDRYAACAQKGTKRICIMPFENKNQAFPNLGDNISDKVIATVTEMNPEFMEFMNRLQAQALIKEQAFQSLNTGNAAEVGKLAGIHAFVFGTVSAVNTKEGDWKQDNYTEKETFTENKQQYTVYARVTKYYKTNFAQLKVSYQEVDVKTGKIGSHVRLEKSMEDSYVYARFSGDERALSYKSKELIAKDQQDPKDPGLMIEELASTIGAEMGLTLFRKYK